MGYIHFIWLYLFTKESDTSRTESFSLRQAVTSSEYNRIDFPSLRRSFIGLNQGHSTCHDISILLGYMSIFKIHWYHYHVKNELQPTYYRILLFQNILGTGRSILQFHLHHSRL